jgi:hypothetical protein
VDTMLNLFKLALRLEWPAPYGLLTRRHDGSFLSRGTMGTSHSCSTFQSSFLLCQFRKDIFLYD